MNRQEMLEMLSKKVCNCKKCPLHETRTQTVFGQGNSNTKIVFIGEGPGRDEDLQGIPFCGRSGQLLTNMLEACGIKRESVYICNIVKCRPPGNRSPTEEESKQCRPFLNLQLKILNPKYIVCLGTTAAQNLLGTDTPISQLRGEWHDYQGKKVLCTFHPSYLLRNPSAKGDSWQDLQLLLKEPNRAL